MYNTMVFLERHDVYAGRVQRRLGRLRYVIMPMTHLPETRAGIQRRKLALDSNKICASFQR